MNIIKGIINQIDSHEGISIVQIQSNNITFKSVILEDESSSSYLIVGNEVHVLFKETEVIIVNKNDESISLRNRINCQIKAIDKGVLLSKLDLEYEKGEISSIITSEAVEKLGLEIGNKVTAMIKTNEIMIAE